MGMDLDVTSWRGLVIEHPAAWELAVASGFAESPRCTFADRFYHRLDVVWQEIAFVPQLPLLLDKHRKAAQKQETPCRDVSGLPAGWAAIAQDTQTGQVLRAARFFANQNVLTEATLVWPDRRDRDLEAAVLEGIRPADKGPVTLWQAMGMSVRIGSEFELRQSAAPVGKVEWQFVQGEGKADERVSLTVTRLAMPRYWLEEPLRDWVAGRAPATSACIRQDAVNMNAHRGEQVLSVETPGLVGRLRRARRYRLDAAWLCPIENRVYHLTCVQKRRDEELGLPGTLAVACCRPPRSGGGTE